MEKKMKPCSFLLLLVCLFVCSCGDSTPKEVQSICRQCALMADFQKHQRGDMNLDSPPVSAPNSLVGNLMTLAVEVRKSEIFASAFEERFMDSIAKARAEVEKCDFSSVKTADGKIVKELKRNEGPIHVVIPSKDKDNAAVINCKILRNDKGEYLFLYEDRSPMFAGRSFDQVMAMLTDKKAFDQEKDRIEKEKKEKEAQLKKKQKEEEEHKKLLEEQERERQKIKAEADARDNAAWSKASEVNTEEAYKNYLAQPDHNLHEMNAKSNLRSFAYKRAQDAGTAEAFKQLLREYPVSAFAGQAKENMEIVIWTDANVNRSASSYGDYLQFFPNGKYSGEAKVQIGELLWQDAKQAGDVNKLQTYIQKYPSGRHTSDARTLMENMEWNAIRDSRDIEKLVQYTLKNRNSVHVEEARRAAVMAALMSGGNPVKTVEVLGHSPLAGVKLAQITPAVVSTLIKLRFAQSVPNGLVVIEASPGYWAGRGGVKVFNPGDVIYASAEEPISDITTFPEIMERQVQTLPKGKSWIISFLRTSDLTLRQVWGSRNYDN